MRFKIALLIYIFLLLNGSDRLFAQNNFRSIALNQIGFYPNAQKKAVITANTISDNFYVTSTNLRDTFFAGTLSEKRQSPFSSLVTRIADFSEFKLPGSFQITIPGLGHSHTFVIESNVHRAATVASLKGYYYQRSSVPLEKKYAGKWNRSAGHPDTTVYIHPSAADKNRQSDFKISTPGGWYDAGDYNKYIVNSGISMGTLLSAYEDYPKYFQSLNTNIPESNNGVPDILNECIYNLRWMLTMQDPNDGGVYNKCTNAVFDGMVMPGVTTTKRYVVQKSTAAALDFASVTAQCARILKSFQKQFPSLSDSCLKASEKAWQWSITNPDILYQQDKMNKLYQPAVTTGAYGDGHLQDEWFWAASELFITTHNSSYYTTILSRQPFKFSVPSWPNVDMLGVYSLIRNRNSLPPVATSFIKKLETHIIVYSDSLIQNSKSAFSTVMGQSPQDFIWGSNAVCANEANLLINTFLLTKKPLYLKSALSNLDYVMGRNATGYCFLTGFGSNSVMHPHHRQSVSDGVTEPVPGLLAGGPNPRRQDGVIYEFTEPETAYTDKSEAYACNEIAINWNAPLVYLLAAIEFFQQQL